MLTIRHVSQKEMVMITASQRFGPGTAGYRMRGAPQSRKNYDRLLTYADPEQQKSVLFYIKNPLGIEWICQALQKRHLAS